MSQEINGELTQEHRTVRWKMYFSFQCVKLQMDLFNS